MRRKFVISLFGRFGNNLSQVALGRYLSELGHHVTFDITKLGDDPSIFRIPSFREFVLARVKIKFRHFPSLEGRARTLGKFLRRLIKPHNIYIEPTGGSIHLLETLPSSWLHGYWQKTQYSQSAILELRNFLSIKQDANVIRIHVRRGDYVGNFSNLSDEYYSAILKQLTSQQKFQKFSIEIISDQPDACFGKFEISGKSVTYLPLGDPISDFTKLASAQILICSKSSFSWWAGLISSGTIYYPKEWDLGLDAQSAGLLSEWIPATI